VPVEAEFTLLRQRFQGVRLRKATRYRCGLATLCHVTLPDNGGRYEAWAADLSETGIGFFMNATLEPGTPVVLRLKGSAGDLIRQAQVAHATLQLDGTWCIGCHFAEPLELALLDQLL
jgi:PilZ domain